MSQRALFVVLFAVLFAACEDDTIVSLNAVNFTKSHLSDIAESARNAAGRTDILAARLAVFTDSAIALADSARVAAVLLAAADHDFRVAASTASAFFLHHKDEAEVIKRAYDAYDARNARLASKAYEVARRTTDQTAATARRAADQAAADSLQVATASIARRAAAAADSLQAAADSAQVVDQTEDDKVARLRRAYNKDAAAQATSRRATAVADSLRAATEAVQAATAARRAAIQAAKVYVAESARLRRAYNKNAVQAAYDVSYAAAYDAAYDAAYAAYRASYCRVATYAADQVSFGTAYADTNPYRLFGCGDSAYYQSTAAIESARYAYATYVDSAGIAAGYAAAAALFKAAYVANSADPQAYAAAAKVAAQEDARRVDTYRQAVRDSAYAARIAARDAAYVTPPISTAIAALATSKAAYQACETYIDSLLNSIE